MPQQTEIDIRVITELDQFRATIAVQEGAWGFSPGDQVPPRLFAVITHIGGLALGAYDGEQMIGFSLTLPGVKREGPPFWHSHMTGVLPAYQGSGIGRLIKLRQREEALRANVALVEWTFDPLEIRNAYFNFEKLGVVARQLIPNCYGITSSPLHGGLPTDRLVAEWIVGGSRAECAVGNLKPRGKQVEATIFIPAEITELKAAKPDEACKIQTRVRQEFQSHFAAGLTTIGFRRMENGGEYQLGHWNESEDHAS